MNKPQREKQWLLKEKYEDRKSLNYFFDVFRILLGEPLSYVIGGAPFLNTYIDLRERTLIPRPETEFWVSNSIKKLSESTKKDLHILDIFSGSGCIGVSVLKSLPNSHVTFSDISKKSIHQIMTNVLLNNIDTSRCRVVRSDIFSKIDGKFDVIYANPPYVPIGTRTSTSVWFWEPKEAIYAKNEGLQIINAFLQNIKKYTHDGSYVYMEHEENQRTKIEKLVRSLNLPTPYFQKDQYGKDRVLELRF